MKPVDRDYEPLWLGVDIGTQGVRALAVDGEGRVIGRGARPVAGHRDGRRHEQDPRRWWKALAGACRVALEGVAAERVLGVAVDGTSGTLALVDRHGTAVAPALMHDDGRAVDQARRVNEVGESVWSSLGYRMQPGWGLPKLCWMVERWPELIERARVVHQPDYLTARLCGHAVATDTSHALKTGYDLIRGQWPGGVLEGLGIPERLLPEVVSPGTRLGRVCEQAAAQTGLTAGTAVLAGMTDGCAAQLATGALDEGDWSSVLGTTLVLKGVSAELLHDPGGALYCHRGPDGQWLPGGACASGAGILSTELPGQDLDRLERAAEEYERSPVLAYPLASSGERFPFVAPDAASFWLGEPETDGERFAALLKGLAFVERLCFDYLDLLGAPVDGRISLTGGATRNRHLSQLRADALGRAVNLPESPEPALGMAVLAAARSKGGSTAEVAAAMVRTRELIEPRGDRVRSLIEPYLRLVSELERREWLDGALAEHARARAVEGPPAG